jgi:hypothetical protein
MRNEAAFSVLSDVPQPFYHVPSKTHICFWMGLGMTQAQAMMFIANYKELAFINNSTMTAAFNEFRHAYILGAFGEVDWRYRLDNGPVHHFNWLANKIATQLVEYDANNHFVKRFTLEKCLRVFQDEQILNT